MVIYGHSNRFVELTINLDSFIFTLHLFSKPDYPCIDIFIDITENYNWDRMLQNFNREKFVPPRPCFSFWFMNHNQCRRTFKFRKGLWEIQVWIFIPSDYLFIQNTYVGTNKNSKWSNYTHNSGCRWLSLSSGCEIFLQAKICHYHSIWCSTSFHQVQIYFDESSE